jgi:hypothetical protein
VPHASSGYLIGRPRVSGQTLVASFGRLGHFFTPNEPHLSLLYLSFHPDLAVKKPGFHYPQSCPLVQCPTKIRDRLLNIIQ